MFIPILMNAQSDLVEVKWLTDYETALQSAKNEEKNLLVYFTGSDWCPPCKMLKKDFFETEEFMSLSEAYILLYIDLPRHRNAITSNQLLHNQKLLAKLNKKGIFPLLTILNSDEKVLDELSGYNMDGKTQRHRKLLKKYSE